VWRDVDHEPPRDDRDRSGFARGGRPDADRHDRDPSDARDVFVRQLDLPRGTARERVYLRGRTYQLRGSDVRTLAAVGAFRVVPERDLRTSEWRARDLRHLREAGLVHTQPYVVGKQRTTLVTLTERGRELLENNRYRSGDPQVQSFYTGVSKPRELAHDAQLYRAYVRAVERVSARGGFVRRVVLEEELKREYQRFLQGSNRRRRDAGGRPDRTAEDITRWARDHSLPMDGEHVQLPDFRIEYDERDGRRATEDVEVTTPHYRGAHAAAKARSGFAQYRATGARVGGVRTSRGGGRGYDPRLAEEILE
jgi:hypothetical protein